MRKEVRATKDPTEKAELRTQIHSLVKEQAD